MRSVRELIQASHAVLDHDRGLTPDLGMEIRAAFDSCDSDDRFMLADLLTRLEERWNTRNASQVEASIERLRADWTETKACLDDLYAAELRSWPEQLDGVVIAEMSTRIRYIELALTHFERRRKTSVAA